MAVTTSQQINNYYNLYKQVEVTFNKQVIQVLGLLPREVFLKCSGENFPCVIYSTSMTEAKVIANLDDNSFQAIKQANNLISLRFSFKLSDKQYPLTFFVSSKVMGFTPYNKEKPNLYFISLSFPQRPPDDLIEHLGDLLEANANFKRRKDLRIDINPATMKELSLESRDALIYIDSVPRKCIVRDISFGGGKILVVALAKFLIDKQFILMLKFEDRDEPIKMAGKVVRFEEVQGRKDIAALALRFDEESIPMQYKIYLSSYLRSHRASLEQSRQQE